MHSAAAFRPHAPDAAHGFAAAYAFAHIFAATPQGPRVAHAPVLSDAAGRLLAAALQAIGDRDGAGAIGRTRGW